MNEHETSREEEQVETPSRRIFLQALGVAGLSLACGGGQEVFGQELPSRYRENKGGWFRSPEEMRKEYNQEYFGDKVLQNCFQLKEGEIVGSVSGNEFVVPQEFVDRILRHLTGMIEAGALQYIFRLDAFHGHPFIEKQILTNRYDMKNMSELEDAKILVSDGDVCFLYHNSEHLDIANCNESALEIWKKRNVIGGQSDQPLEFLPIPKENKRTAATTPNNSTDLRAYLKFAAHKDGAFAIQVGDKEIRLDLSVDDNTYY